MKKHLKACVHSYTGFASSLADSKHDCTNERGKGEKNSKGIQNQIKISAL